MRLHSDLFWSFSTWQLPQYQVAGKAYQILGNVTGQGVRKQLLAVGDIIEQPKQIGLDGEVWAVDPSKGQANIRFGAWAMTDWMHGDPSLLPSWYVLAEQTLNFPRSNAHAGFPIWLSWAQIKAFTDWFNALNAKSPIVGLNFICQIASGDGVTVPIVWASELVVGY